RMRRVLFTILASVAVFAFVPASAMARKHHRRHHQHHARTHLRVHRFGQFTAPGTPTTPQSAGTVTSFDPATGKLVITLSDGTTTETGLVTADTEIECQTAATSPTMGDEGDGGSSGGGDQGDQSGGGDQGD